MNLLDICPFCGGKAYFSSIPGKPVFRVVCKECGATQGDRPKWDHAMYCWNARYETIKDRYRWALAAFAVAIVMLAVTVLILGSRASG